MTPNQTHLHQKFAILEITTIELQAIAVKSYRQRQEDLFNGGFERFLIKQHIEFFGVETFKDFVRANPEYHNEEDSSLYDWKMFNVPITLQDNVYLYWLTDRESYALLAY